MNRIKVWLWVLAVAAAAYVALRAHALQLRAEALADLDARLATASAHVLATTRAAVREASAVAAVAAHDAKLAATLHAPEPAAPPPPRTLPRKGKKPRPPPPPPRADPEAQETARREAARGALGAAGRAIGLDPPEGAAAVAGNRAWLARQGKPSEAEGEAMGFLRGAVAGKAQRGYARLNGAVFSAAAAPVGDGAGIAVVMPADEGWVKGLAGATGALVTLSVPDAKAISTAGPDAPAFSGWKQAAGIPVDVGRLEKFPVALGPLKLPPLPSSFGGAPAFRARAVQLEGLKGGYVVVALPAAPALGAIAQLHWRVALGIALAAVAGVVLGFFVRSEEAHVSVPEELVAAATRIERGDFGARVPPLAGKYGTLGAALNRAAELAGPAAAAQTARAPSEDEPAARPIGAKARPPEPAFGEPDPAPGPDFFQAAAPDAPEELDEEAHFRQVYEEFLRARTTCGEGTEGLTFDKFHVKLDGNKAALVSKYGCKTVRFQVYVKDGKAALKATPVK